MATWLELEREFATAAGVCARNGLSRSAAGRAYYSFFAAVTRELTQSRAKMAHGSNPAHRDVLRHIQNDLNLDRESKKRLRTLARNLYDRRLDADYNGLYMIDERTARESLRDMGEARRILETVT